MEMEKEIREEKRLDPSIAGRSHGVVSSNADLDRHGEEESDTGSHDEDHKEDYSTFTKKQFVDLVKELSRSDDVARADRVLREIKPLFDDIREKERTAAKQRFIDTGGAEEDFDYKEDELDVAFDAHVRLIRGRRTKQLREEEDRKTENLRIKQELLEKLRELVDAQDMNNQVEQFKTRQKEWKAVGQYPVRKRKPSGPTITRWSIGSTTIKASTSN